MLFIQQIFYPIHIYVSDTKGGIFVDDLTNKNITSKQKLNVNIDGIS